MNDSQRWIGHNWKNVEENQSLTMANPQTGYDGLHLERLIISGSYMNEDFYIDGLSKTVVL